MDYAIDNIILVGSVDYPLYRFTNSNIVLNSLSGVFSVDTVGNELSVDTFSLTVRYDPYNRNIYAPIGKDGYQHPDDAVYSLATGGGRDYMTELPYGKAVYWFCDGEYFTKGYLQSVDRIGKYAWRLTVISGVGLLANSYHEGGIYKNTTVGAIISSIIGDVFPCDIDEAVSSVSVNNGWLPYDTRRNNLHRILFAYGAALLRGNENTDYMVAFIQKTETPPVIPDSRIALGGKVAYNLPATKAEITEHSFFQTANDQTDTLFDNTNGGSAERQMVVFDAPHYSPTATGTLVVDEFHDNYAIVHGVGVLNAKAYTHTTQIVVNTTGAAGAALTKRVTDNCMITALNSQNVAKRVLSYFSTAKTVTAKLVQENERCGVLYSFNDAFGDATNGFLQKMTFTPTSVKAALCEFVEGYTPTGQGNFYQHRILVTESETITLPAGVTRIRLVLIAGGDGGDGGFDGEHGMGGADMVTNTIRDEWGIYMGYVGYALTPPTQKTPLGGNAGEAGTQGKIFITDVTVSEGASLVFSIGAAGIGGASNGGVGSGGGETSVSGGVTASSANGQIVNGYVDPINGEIYCLDGTVGHKGGNGGLSYPDDLGSTNGGDGERGESVGDYSGGDGGNGTTLINPYTYEPSPDYIRSSGAGGGGAAWGTDGSDGGGGMTEWPMSSPRTIFGGIGGDGANAVAPIKPSYGSGGGGGNGGGAGGNAGGARWENYPQFTPSYIKNAGGAGGLGSAGGDGGDGCAIIYY